GPSSLRAPGSWVSPQRPRPERATSPSSTASAGRAHAATASSSVITRSVMTATETVATGAIGAAVLSGNLAGRQWISAALHEPQLVPSKVRVQLEQDAPLA